MKRLAYGAAFGALMCGIASAAYAQETTAGIRGQVTNASGGPAAGATVTITHVPTGTTVTTVTNNSGLYTVRGLRVGGPYSVKVTQGGATESSTVQQIGVGDPVEVDVAFAGQVEELVVTAATTNRENNGGPTTRFALADIQELPSLKRDLKDVARLNPFITLDPTNLDAVIAGGTSSRFNSLTVDGVKQNDDFGLNNNGYPTQRSPISTDAVQAMSVNLAPYSVLYNDFQGANINVVTKSGTNEFHGTAFYEYSDENLIGDKATGESGIPLKFANSFKEKSYGASIGGPIIKDKLFFFGNYEHFTADRATIAGPVGSGKPVIAGNPTANPVYITPAQITSLQSILASRYGFDFDTQNSILGDVQLPEKDTKYLAKVDWNITDNHRLALTYQRTSGTRLIEGNRSSSTQLALYSNYYEKGDKLTVYTGQLNSDWTENFRTELTATNKKVVTIQDPVAGAPGNGDVAGDEVNEFGQFSINGNPDPAVRNTNTRILAGPDVSRHANELENEVTNFRGRAFYDLGNHSLTAGAEWEKLKVYNLFGQRTEGEFTFFSFADLQNFLPNQVQYQNAIVDANGDGVRNEQDLAARFDYNSWNFYAQDTWHVTPDLSVTGGVRYFRLEQSDKPVANPFFLQRYGFSNSENLDGRDVFMPRLSFDWKPEWEGYHLSRLRLTGGYGLFSGGAATVWVSNSFSNTGVLGATVNCFRGQTNAACGGAIGSNDNAVLASLQSGADFKNLPTAFEQLLDPTRASIQTIQRAAGVNGIDPNFKPISTWKSSVTFSADLDLWQLGQDWHFQLDFLRGDVNNTVLWQDYRGGLTPIGVAPDGRPIYRRSAERGLFVTGVAGQQDSGNDLILTNTKEGWQQSWAVSLSKSWENGIDISGSYTYTDAKDVNPGTSSVAFSNFGGVATADSNHPGLATSNYEIKNQWKARASWTHKFWGDYASSANLYFERRSGLPYSFVFNQSSTNALAAFGDGASNRQLFYVPKADSSGNVTATSDPKIVYAAGFDLAGFNQYLKDSGLMKYNGRISPRNAFKGDDVSRFDLRLQQELPGFFPDGAKITAYMDIVNLGNLINDKWGVVEQVDFPYTAAIVAPTIINNGTQYSYTNFQKAVKTLSNADAPNRSLWQIKFGLKYSF